MTCRLSGAGVRVPFALTDVRTWFVTGEGDQPVYLGAQGEKLPEVNAAIRYNGSGRLKGRWEIVQPNNTLPESFDLLPEGNLPIERRGLQKCYLTVKRFDRFHLGEETA